MATIQTHNLTRCFDNFIAVDHVDLSVASGEIFGLLGPNAAGKSTIIRILSGILRADAGRASILGMDLFTAAEQIKRRIGYVAQHFALYPDLTVEENLAFYGGLYGVAGPERRNELLETYDLTQFGHRRAGLLSGGYQRRLAIAAATMHDPELIFLDEPTAGIDPVTRKELWDLFYSLAAAGKTLFVTTHYMEEAERCNRLAFLNRGRLVAQGTPQEIRSSLAGMRVYLAKVQHDPALPRDLLHIDGVQLVNQFGEDLRIIACDSVSPERLHAAIIRFRPNVGEVVVVEPNIEDAFMSITAGDNEAKL